MHFPVSEALICRQISKNLVRLQAVQSACTWVSWVFYCLVPFLSQPVCASLWAGALFYVGLGMSRRKEGLDPIASVVFFGFKEVSRMVSSHCFIIWTYLLEDPWHPNKSEQNSHRVGAVCPWGLADRELFRATVICAVAYRISTKREQKVPSCRHARPHYLERGKIKVKKTAEMSSLPGRFHCDGSKAD